MAAMDTEDLNKLNTEVNRGLDRFGLIKPARELNYIRADIFEICQSGLCFKRMCGSKGDCVPYGLDDRGRPVPSDFDVMVYDYDDVVISDPKSTFNPSGGTNDSKINIFYFETKDAHVGYGKLRDVTTDEFLSSEEVAAHFHQSRQTTNVKETERHGPSSYVAFPPLPRSDGSVPHSRADSDLVLAFPVVDGWPQCLMGWFSRERKHGWPTEELIDEIYQNGCQVVPIGHKNSSPAQQRYEWRVSTVLAERVLVRSFNDIQHRTHFILKYVKTCIEKKLEGRAGLTSYHIKTLMLWMVEDNPAEMWQRDNLIHCIKMCLSRFIDWFNEGYVPLYFMPENNLIDTIPNGLRGGISTELKAFLVNLTAPLQTIKSLRQMNTLSIVLLLTSICYDVPFLKGSFCTPAAQENMQRCCRSANNKSVGKHMSAILKAQTQHTVGCELHLLALSEQDESSMQESYFKKAEELLLSSVDLDMSANKLKLANFYYSRGRIAKDKGNKADAKKFFQSAEKYISLALETKNVKFYILYPKGPWLSPHDRPCLERQSKGTIDRMLEQDSGLERGPELAHWVLKNRKFCWPVYYPPKLIIILPKPAQFVLQAANEKHAREAPFIHPVVFGHFLRVLCAIETPEASERMREFHQTCDDVVELRFEKAIGYALLGQLYLMVHNQSDAFKYFVRSYQLWPSTDNCAIWLIFIMYGESRTPTNIG